MAGFTGIRPLVDCAPQRCAGCSVGESEIYAEIKALTGVATSTLGSIFNKDHPEYSSCAKGLVRKPRSCVRMDFKKPDAMDGCGSPQPISDVVDNEVFPLEVAAQNGWTTCFVNLEQDRA